MASNQQPKPRRYAEDTKVPPEKTRLEIEKLLTRHGAEAFLSGWEGERAALGFRLRGWQIRIELPLPERRAFRAAAPYEQEVRTRWRALLLVIKAKIEAIESGITTIEREFLADVVMANGQTVASWAAPQLAAMIESGRMPPLLPLPPDERDG
jgi:hypothetical protein